MEERFVEAEHDRMNLERHTDTVNQVAESLCSALMEEPQQQLEQMPRRMPARTLLEGIEFLGINTQLYSWRGTP